MEDAGVGVVPATPVNGGALIKRRSSVAAAAAAAEAAEAFYGDAEPAVAAPSELRGDVLDSVLRRAAKDALEAIPAQRSVIFTYDRVSNLLSVLLSAPKEENAPALGQIGEGGQDPEDVVTFPPTLGMTGACFLQKRCLRMQEPHRHRAFRREYDVPKGMQVDSILCAPLIIRHRAIAVIQLLNRLNPDAFDPPDELNAVDSPSKAKEGIEDYRDIKLHRMQSVKASVKMGFTAKDEQKLIQFASHLAYTTETRLKRVGDNSITHARIRELQASNAIDLLNILNARLERRVSEGAEVVPIGGAEFPRMSHQLRPPAVQTPSIPIELVGTLVAIIRVQARFRARRIRRSEKFAEALETFRKQHERVRSVLVLQRVARGCIIRKRVKKQRRAVAVLTRVYDHYRFRLQFEIHRNVKKVAPRKRTVSGVEYPPPVTSNNSFKRRSVVVRESEVVSKTLKSATAIQRHFRGHQTRKLIKKMTGFSNLTQGLRNIVKLQSFVRGGLARIQFQRTKEMMRQRSLQTPPSVCLRIGMSPSSLSSQGREARSASSCCVYQLPERRSNAHVVRHRSTAPRHRLETLFDQARSNALKGRSPSPGHIDAQPSNIGAVSLADGLAPASRRLVAASESSGNPIRRKPEDLATSSATASRGSIATITRAFPGLLLEVTRHKGTPRPTAVEYAADRSVASIHPSSCCCHRRRRQSADSDRSNIDSRVSLAASVSTAAVESRRDDTPRDCKCRCCRSTTNDTNQTDSMLIRCNEFRREAFVSAVGQSATLPQLPNPQSMPYSRHRISTRQAEEPLLCCLLPAQPKLSAAFQRAERRLKSRVASIDSNSASSASLAAVKAFAVPSPPRTADERSI